VVDSARRVLASPSITERPDQQLLHRGAQLVDAGTLAQHRGRLRGGRLAGHLVHPRRHRVEPGAGEPGSVLGQQRLVGFQHLSPARYWSTLDSAKSTVSTRSPTLARKFSSPVVNGAEASTTKSSAVADAAAS